MTYSNKYPQPAVCAECLAHAHELSEPQYFPVQFPGHRFVLISYLCICRCGCRAAITTTTTDDWPRAEGVVDLD